MNLVKALVSGLAASVVYFLVGTILDLVYPPRVEWFAKEYSQMMSGMGFVTFFLSILVTGLVLGFLYTILHPSIPGKGWKKGFNYGLMAFFLGGLMFPVMILGYAPLMVAIAEILISLFSWIAAGITVHLVQEKL